MDPIRNGENNAVPPLAGAGEPQFLQELRRHLPSRLYKVGFATGATAVGGLFQQIYVAAAVSLPTLFFLFVVLLGGTGTIYAGYRVEVVGRAANPRGRGRERDAGVAIFFSCFLLLIAAGSIVGFEYCSLALALLFID